MSKRKLLNQLCLFSNELMNEMVKLPPVVSMPAVIKLKLKAKEPPPQLTDAEISYLAVVDCLRDDGYTGEDPVYDFFSGNHPTRRKQNK
jgi:hypothetical protein